MGLVWFYNEVMHTRDANGMRNNVYTDQTAPVGAVQSQSEHFAQICLSQYLEFLQYLIFSHEYVLVCMLKGSLLHVYKGK